MTEAKGWAEKFERLARKVPGMKGYQDKEAFRDSDKAVRLKVSEKLAEVKGVLDDWKRDLVDEGKLADLDFVDRAIRKLEALADRVKYDSYGYSGYFDPVKIRESELEKLYQFDLGLFDEVERLNSMAQEARSGDVKEGARGLEKELEDFEEHLEQRRDFQPPQPPE